MRSFCLFLVLPVAFFIISLTSAAAQSCDPPPSGLMSWWAAEGNALDRAGTNNGTLVGNTTYGTGEVGQGFVMDGNGSGVKVGGATNLWLQNLTIETWIKRASASVVTHDSGGNATIFAYGSGAYYFGINAYGTLFFSQQGNYNYVSGQSITDTNFHHVALTMTNGTVTFYLDGVASAPSSYNVTFTFAGGPPGIGFSADSGTSGFLGTIDEMSIYNRALASNEVAAIYLAGSGGKCFTPVPPVITGQPTNQTVLVGQPAGFSVSAGGTPPLSYQWRLNTTNIAGATNASLLIADAQITNAGTYSVIVSNGVTSILSSNAVLTVNVPSCYPPPSGLVSWWAGEGNAYDQVSGNNGTLVGNTTYGPGEVGQGFVMDGNGFGVKVSGTTNLWLQNLTIETWIKRASTSVVTHDSGGNATIFGYGTGAYILAIGSSGTLFFSQEGNYNYVSGPSITDTNWHHVAVTKVGSTIVFYLDGMAYATPAYSVTFTFAGGPPGIGYWAESGGGSFLGTIDEMSIYSRALSSNEIQGIYNAGSGGKCFTPMPPVITSQPTNQTVLVGQPAGFSVSAGGTPPLSYQWRLNTTNIAGATNASLLIAGAQITNAGTYSVIVSNGVTSILSSNAVLTVNVPACVPPPSGLVSWWAGEGNAFDQESGNNGTLVGNTTYGTGEVGQAFVFTGNDGDGVMLGNPTNLQLQNFTIESWIKRASASIVSQSAPNAEIFSYGLNGYAFGIWSDGRLYLGKMGVDNVSLSTGISDTNWHHVAVTKSGTTVVFYIDGTAYNVAPYTSAFTFTTPAAIGTTPTGTGTITSFLGSIDEMSIYNRALASNEVAAIYLAGSAGKCFTPVPPVITGQPTNVTVNAGDTASFSIAATGTAPLGYQWRLNTTNILNATNATLTLTNVQLNQAGNYSVLVTNIAGSTNSLAAALTVIPSCDPPPSGLVSWWAAEGNAYDQVSGNNGTLVGNTTYGPGEVGQGFVFDGNNGSGVQVSGATNLWLQNLTIETWIKRASTSVVTLDSAGNGTIFGYGTGAYYFGISASGNLFFSQDGNYNYVSGPAITDANFHHVAVTKTGSTIVFYLDGVAYATPAYSVTFTFTGASPGIGYWRVGGSGGFLGTIDEMSIYNRALASNEVAAIYLAGSAGKCFTPAPPSITSQPTNQTVFVGQAASFSFSASGTPPFGYQWRFNTTNILNATNATLTLTNVQLSQAGNYSVLVTNIAGSTNSTAATLTVNVPVCVPPPSGLVSWWAAEGNAYDQISGNNGTLVGNTTYGPGEVGQGFVFDGNGSGVKASGATNLWLQNFTIETWIKRVSASIVTYDSGRNATIFTYGTGAYFFGINAYGNLFFSQLGNYNYVNGPSITDTNWHHVALTMTNGTVTFYLDGVASAPLSYNVTFTFTGGPPGIGFWAGNGTAGFLGTIDEMSIYNRALASNEVAAIYLAGSGGKCEIPHAATATATLAGAFVVGANITDIGFGYTSAPVVHFIGGGGSGASAVAVVSNGVVTAINMISAGSGYTNAPLIVIDPPFIPNPVLGIAPASILTFSNLTIGAGYQLQQFQWWYWTNQPVSFTASNAVYAQAFSEAPSNEEYRLALAPVPAQAFATPQVVNGFVVGATITAGGSGYVTPPAVNISGDAGSNATAVANIAGGAVTNITIINAGMGYTNQVTVQIDPPPAVALSPTIWPGLSLNSSSLVPYDNYQVQFKSNLNETWGNWSGGLFSPTSTTNSQSIFITNGSGYFRLEYVP